ncbi:MAG: hypothetical protein M3619_00500 [Myxococcota bacterium]|nr:hypothetical protein [Myxococcota bacterium]
MTTATNHAARSRLLAISELAVLALLHELDAIDGNCLRRLNRECPACGRKVGMPCREPDETRAPALSGRDRLVPHMARVETIDGPLFGGVSP